MSERRMLIAALKNYCDMIWEYDRESGKIFLHGVFRRGKNPSVLPRDSKTSGATTKMARRMPSRKTLKREEPPV